ncbi:KIAA1257 [Bugula neritina]|uniref:KIAA1257 n=1 Tax=Bugula neritina TaxID=10212 RepID=A0A7J7K3M8_BUGNE|nr:KIAA1257 [Bugula neritina]
MELKSRQLTAEGIDYLADNIRTVMLESRQNKLRKHYQPVQHSAQRIAQNYSTSTFNSTELAKDIIRQNLDKDTLYTYNENYHHSATFVPVNVEELKKQEKLAHQSKFVSKKDWTFPEVKNLKQCNEHPKKPDATRICDLKQEWIENLDHRNKLNPTLEERDIYSWRDRKLDMNTWEYPAKHFEPLSEPPISIMLPGKKLQKELDGSDQLEKELWQRRLVVEDPSMHFYRCNPQTEAIMQGTDVASLTAEMNRQTVKPSGFKPGPFETRSWT